MAETIKIGGELESTATGNVVAAASAIKDKVKNKYQGKINAEVDASLADRYTKAETYNKTELNNMITTPNQEYVSVVATDETNDVTDVLPETGSADTIYRVGNWDGTQYNDSVFSEYAWNGSAYIKLSTKSQVGEVYDISANHAGATYADLAAALGTNGTNIPQSLRKGGMSVKFVQSSDNKYVQWRLMSDSWSVNTDDWSFCGDSVYVENPEWIYVLLDSQKRILAGIKSDGSVEWSIGVPTPVKTYITNAIAEIKNGTEGTDIDGLNKIIAFLSEFSTSNTLKDLLDEKVDKEEGKSLIDEEYAEGVHYIENPEFVEVKVDNEDRILEAIMKDGTKLLPAGVKVIGTAEYDGVTIKTIENPEFAGVWLDNEEHILFGVKTDGNFLFGCGVPRQVKEYIEQKIEELSLDEYESIVTFIGDYLNNTTLEELLSKKVDGEYVENPEFIEAKVDAEDNILEATEKDGTKLFGGDVKVLGSIDINGVNYKVVNNPEWLKVVLDSEDRIICGIKTDGKFVVYVADFLDDIEVIKTRLKELDAYSVTENPEYMEVELDADDKILSGRKVDGTKFENNDVELKGNATVCGSLEVDGVVIKNMEDPEGRLEIATDSENKIISYRKNDGTLVENVGIETTNTTTDSLSAKEVSIEGGEATLERATLNSLELTEQGMTEFQQALKDSGFIFKDAGDYSDVITKKGKNPVYIPLPDCAILNILWDGDLTQLSKAGYSGQPVPIQKVNYDVKCQIEFFDGRGIYFKKWSLIGAQGNSSMQFAKKNISLKIFDTDDVEGKKKKWGKGDTFGIVFGDWVMQKSWHLKAYCTNFFRGEPVVGYTIANKIWESRGIEKDRPWKLGLLGDYTFDGNSDLSASIDDVSLQMDNGARCMPDGFPVIVYQNGEFYGIFSWQIKKDSDNYHMDTDNPVNIHLDGELDNNTFWRGTIDWTKFEIRCPEGLKDMNGDDYDGDHPQEIAASDTKTAIINLSNRYSELEGASTDEEKKELLNTYYDIDNIIDYILFSQITSNYDGFDKNWQWITFDGVKWFVCPYDLDGIFGDNFTGKFAEPADITHATDYLITRYINWYPAMRLVRDLYSDNIAERYAEIREKAKITPDSVINLIKDWASKIGQINYDKEYSKWTDMECNRDTILNSGWKMIPDEYWEADTYDSTHAYTIGEECWKGYRKFRATENIAAGVAPYQQLGYRENIYRIYYWLKERFRLLDTYYSYSDI